MPAQSPSQESLLAFKRGLWKDQRQLDYVHAADGDTLVKHFGSAQEAANEMSALILIRESAEIARVPEPLARDKDKLTLPYIRGIRVFNLFVELDRLQRAANGLSQEWKAQVLERCERNQREIQIILRNSPLQRRGRPYDFAGKMAPLVTILSEILDIVVDSSAIGRELAHLSSMWVPECVVPFRDASTKNMVLAAPDLWLGKFSSEEERRAHIQADLERCVATGEEPDWLGAPIFDFDFASCEELTTPEDDPVSLKYVQRTWRARPRPEDLVWLPGVSPDPCRAALSFIIRYYRFGGRKAAYRYLHPMGHRVRFRHDDERFYFERLNSIVLSFWPEAANRIPVLLDFTSAIAAGLDGVRPSVDQFLAAGLWEKRQLFVDMFPE